ncbi:MAG: hypothetical protein ACHQF4_07845, partial [Sphingobacteriales bacterium]
MSIDIEDQNHKTPGKGKVLVGLLLLVLGIGYLFQQLDFFFIPNWLFSWPSWLIIWGLYVGARHNFRNSGWFIMVLIGLVFLSDDIFPGHNMHHLIWPMALIAFGIWLITKRNQSFNQEKWGRKWENKWDEKWGDKYGNKNPFEPVITPVTPIEPATAESSTHNTGPTSTNIPPTSGSTTNKNVYRGDEYL